MLTPSRGNWIKTDPERTATILNVALQICANLAVVFEPFTPSCRRNFASQLRLSSLNWDMAGRFDLVSDGMEIGKPELLFEKVEDSVVEAQVRKLQEAKEKNLLDRVEAC